MAVAAVFDLDFCHISVVNELKTFGSKSVSVERLVIQGLLWPKVPLLVKFKMAAV